MHWHALWRVCAADLALGYSVSTTGPELPPSTLVRVNTYNHSQIES